eukprot:2029178-Amphidinium_carterae.1
MPRDLNEQCKITQTPTLLQPSIDMVASTHNFLQEGFSDAFYSSLSDVPFSSFTPCHFMGRGYRLEHSGGRSCHGCNDQSVTILAPSTLYCYSDWNASMLTIPDRNKRTCAPPNSRK